VNFPLIFSSFFCFFHNICIDFFLLYDVRRCVLFFFFNIMFLLFSSRGLRILVPSDSDSNNVNLVECEVIGSRFEKPQGKSLCGDANNVVKSISNYPDSAKSSKRIQLLCHQFRIHFQTQKEFFFENELEIDDTIEFFLCYLGTYIYIYILWNMSELFRFL